MKDLEKKIEMQMRYYTGCEYSIEQLADKYYVFSNKFAEAVLEHGDTEELYIKKEAAKRLLLERGYGCVK